MHTTAVLVELDVAVRQGEQGPVPADADVHARVELGSALTDNDGAGADGFAAETLHAKTLALAVASVAYTSLTFLMCHGRIPSRVG